MAPSNEKDLQRQMNETFARFQASVKEMLETQAQERVDMALNDLAADGGPFRIEGAEVDVSIRNLRFAASQSSGDDETGSVRRPVRRRKSSRPAPAGPVRSRGKVREALMAAFEDPEVELGTPELRSMLETQGVQATVDNVHQQLRRLVQAGELTREGRGRYRRAAPSRAA